MKLATVSNSNLEPISRFLPDLEVVCSGTGDLMAWLIDPMSPAGQDTTDVVVVFPDASQLCRPLANDGVGRELMNHFEKFVEANRGKLIVASTLVGSSRSVLTFSDVADPAGRFALSAEWNSLLVRLASTNPHLAVLDIGEVFSSDRRDAFITDSYWYLGRIRFTSKGFNCLATEIKRAIDAWLSRSKKVLVVDLDNTLWGGVVGETGVGGIDLGEDAQGKCYRDFQRHVRQLRDVGVLLAVVSKNDPDLVDEVFDNHPAMILTKDDFVRVDASWTNKADGIRDLAASLDLGLDSFVFIDDNVVERELIKSEIPEVVVPDFPSDASRLTSWLLEDVVPNNFPRLRVLNEDRLKTDQYRSREARKKAETSDMEGFLSSLDIQLRFRVDDRSLIGRVSQLTQKTNQFNLTTHRLSPSEVESLIEGDKTVVITCDYSDRFGDEGTIGVSFLDLAESELTNLIVSCRVLGRGVEQKILEHSEAIAANRGLPKLRATFIPSKRNSVARDFLASAGYVRIGDGESWIGERKIK